MKQARTVIRPMESDDVGPVSSIVGHGYRFLAKEQGFSSGQLEQLLCARCSEEAVRQWLTVWECYVADGAGGVVGVVAIQAGELQELWVLPRLHGAGFGSALFQFAERAMTKAGESTLSLRTTGHATPFYVKMGARVTGSVTCQFGPLAGWEMTCLEKSLPGT